MQPHTAGYSNEHNKSTYRLGFSLHHWIISNYHHIICFVFALKWMAAMAAAPVVYHCDQVIQSTVCKANGSDQILTGWLQEDRHAELVLMRLSVMGCVLLTGFLQTAWTPSLEGPHCLCAGAQQRAGCGSSQRATLLLEFRPLFRLCGFATPARPAKAASAPRSGATTSPETHTSTRWAHWCFW